MGLPRGVSPITFFCVHNISLYISNPFQTHTNFLSVHNTDTFYTQVQINFDRLFSLHLCIFKPTFFMYIHIFLIHKQFLFKNKLLSVHNTYTLFENTFSRIKLRSLVSVSSVHTLNTIGIERSIIPCENTFKPMGLPYGVSPNPPMYIHLCLYINTRSCTYSLPCTQIKLVSNQVTLVFKRSFHRHLFIFPS